MRANRSKIRFITLASLLALSAGSHRLSAQISTNVVCPRDSTGGVVDDGGGVLRTGTPARSYVVSFLSSDPGSLARTETGTSAVDTTTLQILNDRTDAFACRALNSAITGGVQTEKPPYPWVYFRAGGFYFVARWTPAQPLSNYTLRHEAVMVFDASFNLLGVWTA
jgi:hypothetical protein